MSVEEPYYSHGGPSGGRGPVRLVPDDQMDPLRWDQVGHSEPIIRGCCGQFVPALEFYSGQHHCARRLS